MTNTFTDGFSPGDDKRVVAILKKWRGRALSDQLFNTLAGIFPQPTVETVILRHRDTEVEVLLIPRPEGDITWPGMLHSPGQTLRAMDYHRPDNTPINGPFERVQQYEIMTNFSRPPQFVGVAQYSTARGPEAVHIYLARIPEDARLPQLAGWYNIEELENLDNFIQHQIIPIRLAVDFFIKNNRS
jgi:hypothetical protein